MPKRIVINASNLREGGGKTIALHLIYEFASLQNTSGLNFLFLLHQNYKKLDLTIPTKDLVFLPRFFTDTALGAFLFFISSPIYFKTLKTGWLISMGNIAFPFPRKRQLILLHWPYLLNPKSVAWTHLTQEGHRRRKRKQFFLHWNLKSANKIVLQSSLMKRQFQEQFPDFKGETIVYPHSTPNEQLFGLCEKQPPTSQDNPMESLRAQFPDAKFLLCFSKYYEHKNFELLIEAAALLAETKNHDFKIVLNLDTDNKQVRRKVLDKITHLGLESFIFNIGPQPYGLIYELYRSSDGFVLPTFIESFGLVYLEAMQAGIPIFTSNLDFARETCGDAAVYFDPESPEDFIKSLNEVYHSKTLLKTKLEEATKVLQRYPSWNEIALKYLSVLDVPAPKSN